MHGNENTELLLQSNGICERFHKTILDEFYRVAFRVQDTLQTIRVVGGTDVQFLEPFLLEAQSDSESWTSIIGAQFFAIDDIRIMPPYQNLWGANLGEYPFGVSVEFTGYRESIFHEFLHFRKVTMKLQRLLKVVVRIAGCNGNL